MAVTTPSGLPAAFCEQCAEKVTDIVAQQQEPSETGIET